jgi:alanyl-tRNA synthetase
VIAASFPDGKHALLVVVTDDLRERGVRADDIVREIAAVAGGKGGGKPHMAQAGIPDGSRIAEALAGAPDLIRPHLASQ